MLPVLPTIEFVVTPVPPASTELVTLEPSLDTIELFETVEPSLETIELLLTLDDLFDVTELETPVEVFDSTELLMLTELPGSNTTLCAEAYVQNPSATTVTRCLISVLRCCPPHAKH
jgi:hypothetical protein